MIEVNYLAMFLAAIASMALGFFWYSPLFLGKPWMKEKKYTASSLKKEQAKMGMWYGFSFVLALLMAYVLAQVITLSENYYLNTRMTASMMSAFLMWLGFVFPVQATGTIFGDKNIKLLTIDTGNQLSSMMVMGVVLGML